MKYIMEFALQHPFLFTFIMIYLSSWTPIRVYKRYDKPPDEYKVD